MRVLILGSEGQIGKPLSRHLTKHNYEVLELDIEKKIRGHDLREQDSLLEEYLKNTDFVFFLAFDVGGSRYLKEYEKTFQFIENNMMIMSNTFRLLNKYKKPFVFASSQMSLMPWSAYGNLKAVGERHTESLQGVVVHFWNVYGPEYDEKKYHVISDFIMMAKNNQEIKMLTDGKETRQMLYVDDCCEALEIIMKKYSELPKDRAIPVTSFEWTSILEVAEIIGEHFNVRITGGESSDLIQRDAKNIPDDFMLKYWQPKTSLRDGIKKIIESV